MNKKITNKNIKIFLWMALTIAAFLLIIYSGSVASLAMVTGGMKNRFRDIAVESHMSFLIWNNIVVLKGYFLICLGYSIVIFPILKFWIKSIESIRSLAIFWRTIVLTFLITSFFAMRVIHFRPYFLGKINLDHYYYGMLEAIPIELKNIFISFLFNVLPLALVSSSMFYYLYKLYIYSRKRKAIHLLTISIYGLVLIFSLFSFSNISFSGNGKTGENKKLNVLILLSDSLRADHLSVNGYKRNTSPHIDKLAESSMNFSKCFTPIGSTFESIASMMSSQFPHTHGFRHMFPSKKSVDQFNSKTDTIAGVLNKNGYKTIALGDWCASIFKIINCGFERRVVSDFDNFKVYMSEAVFMQHFILPLFFDNEFGYWLFPELEAFASYLTPRVVTDRAIAEIDRETREDNPYFMTVFYSCTHLPYSSSYPYNKMYSDKNYSGPNRTHLNFPVDDFINGNFKGDFGPGEEQQVKDLYDGAINQFDDCVGRIVDHLKKTGQLENTIILVSSDHGDDLFEPNTTIGHGLTFNGGDQSNNIPFILYHPKMKDKAKSISKICRTIDYAPTLIDLLGYKIPESYEGTSLKPYIDGSKKDLSLAFYGETSYLFFKRKVPGEKTLYIPPMDRTTYVDEDFDFHIVLKDKYLNDVIKTKERVLRTEKYKIVYTPGMDHPIYRLYDIKSDPHCTKDISKREKKVFTKMKVALLKWIEKRKQSSTKKIGVDFI